MHAERVLDGAGLLLESHLHRAHVRSGNRQLRAWPDATLVVTTTAAEATRRRPVVSVMRARL